MNIFLNIEKKIKDEFVKSALKARDKGKLSFKTLPEFILEIPKEKKHGDYAVNLAMNLINIEKKNPKIIAESIIEYFDKKKIFVEYFDIKGPGFINIFLNKFYYESIIKEVLIYKKNYGNSNFGQNKKVNIEFVSANPTGLLHIGNARGAVIGDVIANILKTVGFFVSKEYYINDAGNQIEIFGESLEARYLELLGEKIEFPENGYYGFDIIDTVKNFIKINGKKLLYVSKKERQKKLIKYGLKEKLCLIKKELIGFGINYNTWFFESSLYKKNEINSVIKILKKKYYIKEKNKVIWLKTTILGEKKDEVLIRKNGAPTYFAADIAYHKNKFDRGFDYLINVWGADHHGHISRIKNAIKAIGYNENNLEIILMQLVRLFKDGEVLKMSKRSGNYITLKKLLKEVGKDVARYFFIMRSQDSPLDFDLDLAKKKSSENPVYYIQYAYVRISSILNKLNKPLSYYLKKEEFIFKTDIEKQLIKKIGELEKILIDSAIKKEPHKLAKYAYDLSCLFHNFYNTCLILQEEKTLKISRVKLIIAFRYVLRKVLLILGISMPKKM